MFAVAPSGVLRRRSRDRLHTMNNEDGDPTRKWSARIHIGQKV